MATSVVINSATEAVATFEGGVPLQTATDQSRDNRANLNFHLTGTPTVHRAINTNGDLNNFVNPFSLSSSSSGLSCSFNGGCEFTMSGTEGIQTMFREAPKLNRITVCEQECEYNDAASTPGSIKCNLKPVPTTYSNNNFQVGKEEIALNSGEYFGVEDANIAFDGSVFTRVDDNSNTCIVGMQFKEGYVGSLTQVKYFINYITNRDQYEDNLVFEGYNTADATGEDVTELFKVNQSVHEGWNYFDFDVENKPNYRFYRMRGLGGASGPCRLHEVTLSGMEVIQDENTSYTCKPKLFLNGEQALEMTNDVTFTETKSSMLTDISPRYGTRLGGDTVRFTGTNFDSDHSKYTIMIDGIQCVTARATTTYVECVTGRKDSFVTPDSLSIEIAGKGAVSLDDKFFLYVFKWSEGADTWSGNGAPVEGDMLFVQKGLNLLVDIDETPKLGTVYVEGALLFMPDADPNHHRHF
jgi:hypothetical protein